ncbi:MULTISPECIES: DUF1349 domain-containing protein [Gammaproteobacteria]|jgi:regulation of enolase protein 1 (concanavalin A-like superfamily)|uniref:DUF1349 domain-containing protein n=1 Tax=Gammaproteobacteria TaxID=1236 RepID=UPI0018E416CA|nr:MULTISPECIES: DUF1349 domain-containing protein [Gammaproteobacteria]MDO6641577.1 DUF1349 domain-containing protein [Shewanella sp. 5_MG-2023]MDO6677750.1 DUF1349 domain-containing protein [Shewanella sp. 4_MG-2023]MDO6774664.1 DUF1349 domain-containing protein [Shewanella sp. 3_MG-2023]
MINNLDNWTIQNENPEHWSFKNEVLTMQVQEGNIFGAGANDVKNIFIYPVDKPEYSAEVTINLDPNLSFEQAGLGIYWDNDNYIKISKEMFMGARSLVFVVEQNGQPDIKHRLLFGESTVSVKLERSDTKVRAYYRTQDNDTWQSIISTAALSGHEQGVMLYTFSGRITVPNFAEFSEFELTDLN